MNYEHCQIRYVKADTIEEGDLIEVATKDYRRVEDIRENGRMFGAWFEFADCSSRFYTYDEYVALIIEFDEDEPDDDRFADADALASAGHGTDEDYGYYPED